MKRIMGVILTVIRLLCDTKAVVQVDDLEEIVKC